MSDGISDELNDINIDDEALEKVKSAADLKQFYENMKRAEEIKRSINEHTEERAKIVQEMLEEKEKPPSLIKSIIDRLGGA
jgi:hypothetical protein